jgi:transcriptional regulator with XRE-family HTH domain
MPAKRRDTEGKRMAALAGLITQRRHERGLTQGQLGKAIHASQSTIGRYTKAEGTVPDEDRIISIAKALDADPVEFLAAAGRLSGETFETSVIDQLANVRKDLKRLDQAMVANHGLLKEILARLQPSKSVQG